MTFEERNEILNSYSWIKIKSFNPDDYISLEERYKALVEHHQKETTFLIQKVRDLAYTYGPAFDLNKDYLSECKHEEFIPSEYHPSGTPDRYMCAKCFKDEGECK